MKRTFVLCTLIVFISGLRGNAAFTFYATDLPSQPGESSLSCYYTNNARVAALLAPTTNSSGLTPPFLGPVWNLSQPQQTNAAVIRTGIVAPEDGTDGSSFPDAAYAEQSAITTLAGTNILGWQYYSITNAGRVYYGMYAPNTAADGLAAFDPAIVDIPATVTNNQAWTNNSSWTSIILGMGFRYVFSETAQVDGVGTLVLPNFGALSAIRVHEVHVFTGLLSGNTPYENGTNQCYYWLVPKLGVVAQINIYGNVTVGGMVFTPSMTNSVQRMYYASYYAGTVSGSTNSVPSDLFIKLQGNSVYLNWNITNASSYQVEASGGMDSTNWQVLGLTTGTNWTDSLSATQRFYRVVGF